MKHYFKQKFLFLFQNHILLSFSHQSSSTSPDSYDLRLAESYTPYSRKDKMCDTLMKVSLDCQLDCPDTTPRKCFVCNKMVAEGKFVKCCSCHCVCFAVNTLVYSFVLSLVLLRGMLQIQVTHPVFGLHKARERLLQLHPCIFAYPSFLHYKSDGVQGHKDAQRRSELLGLQQVFEEGENGRIWADYRTLTCSRPILLPSTQMIRDSP